jgi:sugar phosphate isomerase/epimerase
MKIGLQLFTLRDHLQTPEQIKETLKKVKKMGYDLIQVSGIGQVTEDKANVIKEECEKLGLEVIVTHTSLHELENNLDWVINYHKLWNCAYVGIGAMPGEYAASKETIVDFAKKCNVIAEALNKEGITLVYHNHAFEFRRYNGVLGLDILKQTFNELVQFELDTYWVQCGGANPVQWIKNVEGKMDIVHFKDMVIQNWNDQLMEIVGAGNLEWDAIIKACEETGVKWAFVEQDDTQGRDPFECAKLSLQFLKSKGF